jgi:pilus assembly protein Flp/PilA
MQAHVFEDPAKMARDHRIGVTVEFLAFAYLRLLLLKLHFERCSASTRLNFASVSRSRPPQSADEFHQSSSISVSMRPDHRRRSQTRLSIGHARSKRKRTMGGGGLSDVDFMLRSDSNPSKC